MEVIYIETKPHKIHKEFADTVWVKKYSYYLLPIFDNNFIRMNWFLSQFFSIFSIFFIPKSDVYLVDAVNKWLPVVIKKIFHKDIQIISLNANSFFRDYVKDVFLVKKYKRFLCKYIDGVISVTNEVNSYVTSVSNNMPSKVVYPFIDVARFKGGAFDAKSRNILSIGWPSKVKWTDILISAFLKLSRFYPDYTLTIIGNGEWYDLFKKKYRQYTSINFPGYTRDLLSFIKQSFFYIQPSRSEASGTAVLEMMYCWALPAVSTHVGFKELVGKIEPDFVFELTENAVINLLEKVYRFEYDIQSLWTTAKTIAQEYTKERQTARFKQVFLELIWENEHRNSPI